MKLYKKYKGYEVTYDLPPKKSNNKKGVLITKDIYTGYTIVETVYNIDAIKLQKELNFALIEN